MRFQQEVSIRANSRVEDNVEGMWKGLKECLLEVSDEVCGRTKRPAKRRQTWWWNEDVAKAVEEKRRLYKVWYKSKDKLHEKAYQKEKKEAKKAVYLAKVRESKRLGEWVDKNKITWE